MVWMLCVKLITKAKIADISPHIFMEAVYFFFFFFTVHLLLQSGLSSFLEKT